MTNYEWITLIAVLIGGFWHMGRLLAKIEVALSGKVSYRDCAEQQEKCPCRKRVDELEERVEKYHSN